MADQERVPYALTDFLPDYGWGRGTQHIATLEDGRPFVELATPWSPQNVQWVLALVDTGADSTALYGNQDRFQGPSAVIEGYGGQTVWARRVAL